MTGFLGADTDQLRAHGRATTSNARALDEAVTTAIALARQVSWTGSDAESFRGDCEGVQQRTLQVMEDLRRRAEELIAHADEQDEVSGAAGGGAPGRGGAHPIRPGIPFPLGPLNPFGPGSALPTGPGISSPFGPLDPFGPGSPQVPLEDILPFGGDDPMRSPFGPMGPISPNGPLIGLGEKVTDGVLDGGSWDWADRAERWGKSAWDKAWGSTTDALGNRVDWLKDSKLFDVGRKAVPMVPDLISAGGSALDGDAEQLLWNVNRSAFEALPGVTVADLIGGEFTSRLGDEHTVFGSDIRWNEGTPMDGLESYMVQRTRELGYTEPGEAIGEGFADRAGIENDAARGLLKSGAGVGVGVTFNSPVAWGFDAVTPGDQRAGAYEVLKNTLT